MYLFANLEVFFKLFKTLLTPLPPPFEHMKDFFPTDWEALCAVLRLDNGREGVKKKTAVLLDFVQITSQGAPPIWTICKTILNAKNFDLSGIQNDSLSKILLE